VAKAAAWVIAGAAVLASAGVAHAQQRPAVAATAPASESPAEATAGVPWYQHFTTNSGLSQTLNADAQNDQSIAPTWTLNPHWGVTVDVREAQRMERSLDGGHGNQTSLGAYYQFTPSVRLGGEFSLETSPRLGTPEALIQRDANEPRANVKIESAFRF
jgi:two component system regulator NtrZ-like protein (phosphatase activity inhibitor)